MARRPNERRQQPRIAIATDVDLTSGDNFYAGRTRDISVGGLFIDTDATFPIGYRIAVKLNVGGKSFSLDAEVMWVLLPDEGASGGIGVSFCNMPADAARAIASFMARREPSLFDLAAASMVPPSSQARPAAPPGPPPLPPRSRSSVPPRPGPPPLPFA